jgi:imidazolonepropionase-like amidohydrolase
LWAICIPCDSTRRDANERDEEVLVLGNVNIVDVRAKEIVAARDIFIADGRIAEIREHDGGVEATVDADGAYAIAGLYDAHTHIDTSARLELMLPEIFGTRVTDHEIDDDLAPYIAFGITGIVVLDGNEEVLAARDRARVRGAFLPRIVAASPILDGPASQNPLHSKVATPEVGSAAVTKAWSDGYDLIKTYYITDKRARAAIIARAGELDMPVTGHLPPGMPFEDAIVRGFSNVAHAEEITRNWDGEDRDYLAEAVILMAEHAVSFTPNLVAYREIADEISDIEGYLATMDWAVTPPFARVYASPPFNGYVNDFGGDDTRDRAATYFRRIAQAMDELTLDAHGRGVLLLGGSDTGNPTMFPGQSLYRELSLLKGAGLDGYDALAAATLNVAAFLGEDAERGSIEVGNVADLVLFRVNPVDTHALERDSVLAVVRNGVLFDRARIAREVERISASFDEREARYMQAALAKLDGSAGQAAE